MNHDEDDDVFESDRRSNGSNGSFDEVHDIAFEIFNELRRVASKIEGGEDSLAVLAANILKLKNLVDETKRDREALKEKVSILQNKQDDLQLQIQKEKLDRKEMQDILVNIQKDAEEETTRLLFEIQKLETLPSVVKRLETDNSDWSHEVHSLQNRLNDLQKRYEMETSRNKSLLETAKRNSSLGSNNSSLRLNLSHTEEGLEGSSFGPTSLPLSLELASTNIIITQTSTPKSNRGTQTHQHQTQSEEDDTQLIEEFNKFHLEKKPIPFKIKLMMTLMSLAAMSNILGFTDDPYLSWYDLLRVLTWDEPESGRFVPM